MKLMVVSPSTKKYAKNYDYDEIRIVRNPPTINVLKKIDTYDDCIAIGGGSVIDTAKIICKNEIVAIPTTYAGACSTKHAVYWYNNKKYNVPCKLPTIIIKEEYVNLPRSVEVASKIDCLAHIIESLVSPNSTQETEELCMEAIYSIRKGDWLYASVLAGACIDKTGTNIIHSMSYPLTGKYKIPHGVALHEIFNLASHYKKMEELL